ncbi:MAG: phosphatase PAP2 family protein [Chloroflexota bacterium]
MFRQIRSRYIVIAAIAYSALVVVASFHFNLSLSPDRVVVLLLIIGLCTGRARLFLKDWSLFLVVLLAWQVLSGYSRHLGHFKPHITEMIVADRAMFFGHLPTIWLQHHFFHPGHPSWYDIVATVLYSLHFVMPIAVAFVLWQWRRPVFVQYMRAFVLLAFAGFATYVLFPAAPPWLAAKWHYLPHIARITQAGYHFFGGKVSLSALYHFMLHHGGYDLVAAMPSEHAAFPFLGFLYLRQVWPRWSWVLFPYCVAVWVAVIYLGEHYATDVIAGIAYAAAAYVVVRGLSSRRPRKESPELEAAASGSLTA